MFTKIHLAFYNILFDIYGKLATHYLHRAQTNVAKSGYYEPKYWDCIEKREDILDIMFTLKGLI